MSANLITQAVGTLPLGGGVKYEFSITPSGATQEFLAYQIYDDVTGQAISDVEVADPRGNNVTIDIARELKGLIDSAYTADFGGGAPVKNEDKIIGTFYLKYGTVEVNEVSGECEVITSLEATTGVVNVIRSTPQYNDTVSYTAGAILSKRPKCYSIHKDAEDYITIARVGGGTVDYTAYDIDGNTLTGTQGQLANNVNLVAMSPAALGNPAFTVGAVRMDVRIQMGVMDTTYTVMLKDCCLGTDHVEVHFLEPLGAWATMCFECQRGDASVSYQGGLSCSGVTVVDQVDGLAGSLRLSGSKYGIINRESKLQLNLVLKEAGRIETMKWQAALGSARKAYVYVLDTAGDRVRVNFLLQNGTIDILQRGATFDLIVAGLIILENE